MSKAVQGKRGERRYRRSAAAVRSARRERAAAAVVPVYARQAEDTDLFHPDDWEQEQAAGFEVRERRDCRLYGWGEANLSGRASSDR